MSITSNYCKITKEQFFLLKENKITVSEFLYSDKGGMAEEDALNIDKSWDCINFILTGKTINSRGGGASELKKLPPVYNVVMGGQKINDEDVGYGSARYLTENEVSDCYEAIKDITEEYFKSKYHLEAMIENAVYPLMGKDDDDEFFDDVFEYFKSLQLFFESASLEGKYILFYMN